MTGTSPWIKATRSGESGNCVEMRTHAGSIEIRDTKDRGGGPTLRFTNEQFAALLEMAKRGALHPLQEARRE